MDTIAQSYELPKEIVLESEFGNNQTYLHLEVQELTNIRKRVIHKGIFPAKIYIAFVNYMSAIIKADKSNMVLYKK